MPARWTGKPGKIVPLKDKRETNRFSIKVPGRDDDFHECRTRGEYNENQRKPIAPGSKQLYTPEQVYNYKSQWARYERSLELIPDKIGDWQGKLAYFYASCDAPTGFWHVTLEAGATFVKAGKYLTIICPVPYQLNQVESDGEEFVWTQRFGNRTVTVQPPNAKNPTLYFEDDCYTPPQCDSGTDFPIIMRVQVKGQLNLFDDLLIFTTPTSNHFGNSFVGKEEETPCKKVVTIAPAPIYPYKAYKADGSPITITWEPPQCKAEFIVKYVLQVNTTGNYIDVEDFGKNAERLAEASVNTHYRIKTEFLYRDKTSYSYSKPIYYSFPKLLVFADDTQRGISFAAKNIQKAKQNLSIVTVTITDAHTGISKASKGFHIKYKLTSQKIQPISIQSGISFVKGKQSYKKYNLGNVIIR